MTHFLITDDNPEGFKLEDILVMIRNDILKRGTLIMDDHRPEARTVLNNNIRILGLLAEAIATAEESSQALDRSFGPSRGGEARIGRSS